MSDRRNTGAAGRALGPRGLPSLQLLLERDDVGAWLESSPREAVVGALRTALAEARDALRTGADADAPAPAPDRLVASARTALDRRADAGLRRVVNATGIVLHTNLGRAPLADAARAALIEVAQGYTNLELDLETGRRGGRLAQIGTLLCAATGAEAAIAVNNNAAATLLAIAALADGGEVVVSRGELVEIGGGFRIPDVIRQGGGTLVEVGTTNKTRIADYRDAIGPATRVLLKVHQSNYRIVGFTDGVAPAALVGLARERGIAVVDDLGSGCLTVPRPVASGEPTVREAVASGADLVTFSGDKLLGGPQAGLIVGREAALAKVRRHPLLRAMRLDKLSAAALEATLALHADPARAMTEIPALRMLTQDPSAIASRAERLASRLEPVLGSRPAIVASEGRPGGGALPEAAIASRAVALALDSGVIESLRRGRPSVVGRIHDGRLLLDLLTIADDEVDAVADAVGRAMAACRAP